MSETAWSAFVNQAILDSKEQHASTVAEHYAASLKRGRMPVKVSRNDRAGVLMGYRPGDTIPFDQPCELGYWCPVCRVPAMVDGDYDERLSWSEYRGFLWCAVCNRDYPSALCVPLVGERDLNRSWVKVGPDDAVGVYLDTVEDVLYRFTQPSAVALGLLARPVGTPVSSQPNPGPEDVGEGT